MSLCRRNLHEMAGDNIGAATRACKSCENARKRGEALPSIVSKAKMFRAELQRRYPCSAYPIGAVTEIAAEYGLDRSTAARYARQIDYTKLLTPPKYLCICGKVMEKEGAVCRKCRWIELPCAECKKPVRRRISVIVSRESDPRYKERRIFCNQRCHGVWLAKQPCPKGHPRRKVASGLYCLTCANLRRQQQLALARPQT